MFLYDSGNHFPVHSDVNGHQDKATVACDDMNDPRRSRMSPYVEKGEHVV